MHLYGSLIEVMIEFDEFIIINEAGKKLEIKTLWCDGKPLIQRKVAWNLIPVDIRKGCDSLNPIFEWPSLYKMKEPCRMIQKSIQKVCVIQI